MDPSAANDLFINVSDISYSLCTDTKQFKGPILNNVAQARQAVLSIQSWREEDVLRRSGPESAERGLQSPTRTPYNAIPSSVSGSSSKEGMKGAAFHEAEETTSSAKPNSKASNSITTKSVEPNATTPAILEEKETWLERLEKLMEETNASIKALDLQMRKLTEEVEMSVQIPDPSPSIPSDTLNHSNQVSHEDLDNGSIKEAECLVPPPELFAKNSLDANLAWQYQYAKVLWAGLEEDVRKAYVPAINSYEAFCGLRGITPWPAYSDAMSRWVAEEALGSKFVEGTTWKSYISVLRTVNEDQYHSTAAFDCVHLRRLVEGAMALRRRKENC